MGFESKVMQVVEEVVGKDDTSGFAYGTLFVTCLPNQAKTLRSRLSKEFSCGVQVSPQGGYMEYAFDFTN